MPSPSYSGSADARPDGGAVVVALVLVGISTLACGTVAGLLLARLAV